MSNRTLVKAAGAAALIAAGLAFSAPASAGTVWSVSIGGPGYAVYAGDWGPRYYGPGYRYGYRHWHRAYVPGPVVYPAPVVVAPTVVYPAPIVYRAPRVVYSAPVVVRRW